MNNSMDNFILRIRSSIFCHFFFRFYMFLSHETFILPYVYFSLWHGDLYCLILSCNLLYSNREWLDCFLCISLLFKLSCCLIAFNVFFFGFLNTKWFCWFCMARKWLILFFFEWFKVFYSHCSTWYRFHSNKFLLKIKMAFNFIHTFE